MGVRFIFMLTRDDRTVEDASDHLQTALFAGVRNIGFKDVGMPFEALKVLNAAIKIGGATRYLEVVSLDRESEVRSARAAVEIGVDVLLGGTHVEDVLPLLAGSGISYFPFPGRVTGHPSVLEGSIEEIVASAQDLARREEVHGLDLLAYRAEVDVPELIRAVCGVSEKPVIVAGSISDAERIEIVKSCGAAGFTIGTAALNGDYPAEGRDVASKLAAIMRDVATINMHISPHSKQSLAAAFSSNSDLAVSDFGQVNGVKVRLVRYAGEQGWHYHPKEDQLLLVQAGRLLVKFRDREEALDPGELIVVPRGVEHCVLALSGVCEVVRVEPGSIVE